MESTGWSVPEEEIRATIATTVGSDRRASLATVIDVEGSAYRRPGAKTVIEVGGAGTGAITAGCLEDDVAELASEVIESGEPTVVTYDLMDDDVWGLAVGCNGIIDVLVQPLDDGYESVARGIEAVRDRADRVLIALRDMLAVTVGTIQKLVRAYRVGAGGALAAAHEGRRGYPVLFDERYFSDLTDVNGDVGGWNVLLYGERPALVETGDPCVHWDVDTLDDLDNTAVGR